MTKTTAHKAEKAESASTYVPSFHAAFEGMPSKLEIPAAARDFVKRAATSAKQRAEGAHDGAASLTDNAEKFAASFFGGYANFTRGLLDMALANVQHTLSTVEKLAGATSINEAVALQADFVRENASANIERIRGAAETARDSMAEGARTFQAEFSRLHGKAA